MPHRKQHQSGFTIVELLIVIVVIGILAAITIVAYNGVTRTAAQATLQSDLRNAQGQIGVEKETTGSFPSDATGVKASPGTTYEYDATATTYCITASSEAAQTSFFFDSAAGVIEEGTCPGHSGLGGPTVPSVVVASGGNHTCALTDGRVYCWGQGNVGQLGNNTTSDSSVPVAVSTAGVLAGRTVTAISAGATSTCALADGLVFCWGDGSSGQLGNNSTSSSSVPVAVSTSGVLSGRTVTAIGVGGSTTSVYRHACALADGQVFCWGANGAGQLGNNSTTDSSVPVAVSTAGVLSGRTVTSLQTGDAHTCAVADNLSFCWGFGGSGQLGVGSSSSSSVPVAVSTAGVLSGRTVSALSAGGSATTVSSNSSTCAIADSLAFCWGRGTDGRLGQGASSSSTSPVAVSTAGVLSGRTISQITSGAAHTCAVADSLAFCWGLGSSGRLGNGAATTSNIPVAVDATGLLNGRSISDISNGSAHTCVVADGELFCWGAGTNGRLGNGLTSASATPVAVSPLPTP